MRSRAVPLLWEILHRGRGLLAGIAGATALSWLIDFAERHEPRGPTPSAHNQMLAMMSFVALLAIFSCIEAAGDRGMGRFPRRLFLLPVSTLQLVAIPVIAGIVAVELFYLLWMGRLSGVGPEATNRAYVAVLLGAFMVCYQAVLWTLERLGPLRLLILGAAGIAFLWIGILPSMEENGDAFWQSERVLGGGAAALASLVFLVTWGYIARARSEAESDESPFGPVLGRIANALPRRRGAFPSAQAAHSWFEWRSAGSGYPVLVGGALVLLLVPVSIWLRDDGPATIARIVAAALALPVIVAIPAGLAFSKPMFWSEEMALLPFVSVKPLSDEALIAIKVRIAAFATLISWLLVLGFLGAWLALWANESSVDQLLLQLRALDDDWWLAIAALVVLCAMFVSWRFLVAGLWAGMSGSRALFTSMFAPAVLLVIASIFDVAELPRWIAEDLRRLAPFLWVGAVAVAMKLWLAALGFRLTSRSWPRTYLAAWLAGVACLIGLGAVLVSKAGQRLSESDADRVWAALVLCAMLLMPLARIAWAPWFLRRNRHRG